MQRSIVYRASVVLLLVALFVLGCAPLPAQPPPPAPTQAPPPAAATQAPAATGQACGTAAGVTPEVKNLRLHFQADVAFVPVALAIKKGWFKDAGFENVEQKSFTAGALAGEALIAGEIDVWTPGNVPVINMRHNGKPVVVVGNMAKSPVEKLVVRNDAGVNTPEDLSKVKIGLLSGSTAEAVLSNIANHYKLDASKLQVVNLPPPEQLTAFTKGDVQAILVWGPFNYQARDAGGKFVFNSNVSGFDADKGQPVIASHTRSPIVFSEDFMRKNPNTAKALLCVYVKAVEYASDPANKAEGVAALAELAKTPAEIIELSWDDFGFDGKLDQSYVDDMQNYTDYLAGAGRIQNPSSPLTYTYTGLLSELRPDWVQVTGEWKP